MRSDHHHLVLQEEPTKQEDCRTKTEQEISKTWLVFLWHWLTTSPSVLIVSCKTTGYKDDRSRNNNKKREKSVSLARKQDIASDMSHSMVFLCIFSADFFRLWLVYSILCRRNAKKKVFFFIHSTPTMEATDWAKVFFDLGFRERSVWRVNRKTRDASTQEKVQ